MVLSKKDSEVLRENFVKTIKYTTEKVRNSPSEELYCLNIDWFRIE
mgnify:CR=1 FL=1